MARAPVSTMPSTASSKAPISVISGDPANISGNAPDTSATARRLRSPTIWVWKRFSTRWAFPITPTTGRFIGKILLSSSLRKKVLRKDLLNRARIPAIMPATARRINMLCSSRVALQLRENFRAGAEALGSAPGGPQRPLLPAKRSPASIASPPGRPAARRAVAAAALSSPFSHGSLGQDPAGDRLAEHAAEIERPESVRHHLGGNPLQAVALASTASASSGGTLRAVAGLAGIGERHQHRDQRTR